MDLAGTPSLALYFAQKGAAYALWCGVGVLWFRPERVRRAGLAIGLGALRLCLGLLFGVAIFFASVLVYAGLDEAGAFSPTAAMLLTYAAVYLPVRWIEWGIIEAILTPRARSLAGFALGAGSTARGWRAGGALISCLADVPLMLAAGGLPMGRFMC